jgi:hypothetical protein
MKALTLTVIIIITLAVPVLGAPGDPRLIQGTLEWPQDLSQQPFVVVRGDDGSLYYANVSTAERRGSASAGARLAILGVEGTHPNEVVAMLVTTGGAVDGNQNVVPAPSAATAAATAPAQPSGAVPTPGSGAHIARLTLGGPSSASPTTDASRRWTEIRGVVQALTARTVVLKADDGQRVIVDVSALSPGLVESTAIGSVVTVYGVPVEQRFKATGFIESD